MAKARRVRGLTPMIPFRSAAARIIATKYAEMVAYTEAAISGHDPVAVHDMRVACKRLREAINVLGGAFGRSKIRSPRADVEALNDGMGGVRESDVFLQWLEEAEAALASDAAALHAIEVVRRQTEERRQGELAELEELFAELLPERLASDIAVLSGKAVLREAMRDG